jgi:hypothetical protein
MRMRTDPSASALWELHVTIQSLGSGTQLTHPVLSIQLSSPSLPLHWQVSLRRDIKSNSEAWHKSQQRISQKKNSTSALVFTSAKTAIIRFEVVGVLSSREQVYK